MRTFLSTARLTALATLAALPTAALVGCSSDSATPGDSGPGDDGASPVDASSEAASPADAGPDSPDGATLPGEPVQVKAMIISMFGPEGQVWIDNLKLTTAIPVRGLYPDYPDVQCDARGVCDIITGEGHANAAASISALVYSGAFDLTKAYFLIAGIAGIDPKMGTTGSAAWARYVVDYGLSWELDAREMPAGWKYGYFGINTPGPGVKPSFDYRTELYQVNEDLLQRAMRVSANVVLEDDPTAVTYRAHYAYAPANSPPTVIQCDTASGDTWFEGTVLGERAEDWTKLLTDGAGNYCTTEQEDNATFEVLKRASSLGLLDVNRVAVLRTGSDFDRPYDGQSDADSLVNYANANGFQIAIDNLFKAGDPFIEDIVANGPFDAGPSPVDGGADASVDAADDAMTGVDASDAGEATGDAAPDL
jgi:purine nucleoside permease